MSSRRTKLARAALALALLGTGVVAGLAARAYRRAHGPVVTITPERGVERIEVDAAGRLALFGVGDDNGVPAILWSAGDGPRPLARGAWEDVRAFAVVSDGETVVATTGRRCVVARSRAGQPIWERDTDGIPMRAALVPGRALVAVAAVTSFWEVQLVSLQDGALVHAIPAPVETSHETVELSVSPDGRVLVLCSHPSGGPRTTYLATLDGARFEGPFDGWPVGFSERHELLLDDDRSRGTLRAVSLDGRSLTREIDVAALGWEVHAVAGDRFLVHKESRGHAVIELPSGRELWRSPREMSGPEPRAADDDLVMVLSPHGDWVALAHRSAPPSGRVEIYALPP